MTPELPVLIQLFYDSPALLGRFDEVSAADIPAYYRRLLAHENHMPNR